MEGLLENYDEQDNLLWGEIKAHLLSKNPDNKHLKAWLDPIKYIKTKTTDQGPTLVLTVPSDFHRNYVIESLLDKIFIEMRMVYPKALIDIIVNHSEKDQDVSDFLEEPYVNQEITDPLSFNSYPSHNKLPNQGDKKKTSYLDPNFTFSTFVVGRNSEFAHAACYNVAKNPGQGGYNPLLICGPVGMGKTHLLHAVGHEIAKASPHLKILYLQAEHFLNEFISAVRNKKTDDFRSKYRDKVDILLFDDTQFIGKGESTQEEFFHIFNSLIDKKKQIVLASDRRPKDILKLEDRNRSRLEWGLTVDITMPDYETRVAILRYKAELLGMRLSEDVVTHIAKVSKRSIREIEGNLKTVKMFSELQGVNIDLGLTKRVLTSTESQNTITVDEIIKIVSDHFNIKLSDLKSSTRAKTIVVPRQMAMFLIKKHLDKSYSEIGRYFGKRDHTTVMNAIFRINTLHAKDLDIRNHIEDLTTQIHNITGV